ncbi:leucine-rich repeat serine/threonine-protein kinase 1-like [Gigantopelta aegis]|uniref:leucine-rich repeat serine/threonine-protein kinase 1-like n=1 Tax=Gigantopelta aegis TaxID=1735272 RepID=UPI001B888FF5|nr:leucine-rich repeat serine/threonine-protein kinase 1-like [Gigantopelta aegis]
MADLGQRDDTELRLLIQACLFDNTDLLNDLIQGGEYDINEVDCWGRTPVYTAVSNNSMHCLEILIENGADINRTPFETSCDKRTPLHTAVFDGKIEAVRLLLNHDANVHARDQSGRTPLDIAKQTGNREIVTCLNSAIEMNNRALNNLSQKLYIALTRRDVDVILQALNENKAEDIKYVVTQPPGDSFPALCSACKLGNLEIVKKLLSFHEQATQLAHEETGYTPLHIACEHGNVPLIELLLKKFPEQILMRTVDHQLPLHKSAACGMADAVRCLLQFPYGNDFCWQHRDRVSGLCYWSSIDINEGDFNGRTALHLASEKGYLNVVQILLDFSVNTDPDAGRTGSCRNDEAGLKDQDSHRTDGPPSPQSSMQGGSSRSKLETVHPVNVNHVTNAGHTALHLAIEGQHCNIAEALLKAGADIKMAVQFKDSSVSLLSFTLSKGDTDLFRLMMEHGAEDVDNAVMFEATQRGNHTIQQLLLQHKSSRDLTRIINKSELKLRWYSQLNMGSGVTSFSDRSSSLDAEHRALFPLHSVAINWQNIGGISDIPESTLKEACYLHNPAMQRVNSLPLYAITKIDISKNNFEKLPLIIFELFSLCVLNASDNRIKAFPSEEDIESSSMVLEELYLNDNCLQLVPSYLFKLPKLKHLNLSKNELKDIPIDMWTAPMLVTLNLSRNKLSCLPFVSTGDFVPGYRSETETSDTDSVHSIVKTNAVPHFNRWHAGVVIDHRELRNAEGQKYTGIQQLDLSRNRFTEIPLCLACCAPQLEVLSLQENCLNSVGMLSNLPDSLVDLNLSYCNLETLTSWSRPFGYDQPCLGFRSSFAMSSLPSSVRGSPDSQPSPSSHSSQAGFLQQSCCQHRNHSALKKLDKLNVSHNRLRFLTLMKAKRRHGSTATSSSDDMFPNRTPTETSDLTCSLGLEIEEIRSRLLFPELSELDVSSNSLTSLPSEIGEHSNLKVLYLNCNRALKELPPRLGMLKQLWKLEVQCCSLEGAIQDFIRNSPCSVKDILGFLLSVFEESTEYNCMNLMLVGSHKIGKTSLLHKLRNEGKTPFKVSHWRERVSNMKPVKTEKDELLSTVGIDINELIIKRSNDCVVNFRTWDFGGQREYYATHQYFLSPRSLYLVMWDVTENQPGINNLLQWLVNIQARAPGAPVIIVGTHLDLLKDTSKYPLDYEEAMTGIIKKMFLMNREPDKCGLPNILDTIFVSCKTGKNISKLVEMIANHAFEIKHPRSRTQKLLKQKIPKKYLQLKHIVEELARERMEQKKDPVLSKSNYMLCVSKKMLDKQQTFRDPHELDQATRFLHENGVMFHYDDLQLRDLFFLDPQWLCDQLAKVVTIKEINNFASKGVMKTKNLDILFRSPNFETGDIQSYITNLLNKFEVALKFDEEHLLLPSLLPTEKDYSMTKHQNTDIKIPLRRESGLRRHLSQGLDHMDAILCLLDVKSTTNPIFSYCRLYFMTYFPSGFWPRLITRVLADTSLYDIVLRLFQIPADLVASSPGVKAMTNDPPEWRCWQTGLSLYYLGVEILRVREVQLDSNMSMCDYTVCRIKCNIDSEWSFLDVINSKLLEISFQTDSLAFQVTNKEGPQVQTRASGRLVTVYRDDKVMANLMVKIVSHVDNLLQDWYPELGEQRFCQNCEGRYLITRVIPCPQCLNEEVLRQRSQHSKESWMMVNRDVTTEPSAVTVAVGQVDVPADDVFEPQRPDRLLAGQTLQHHRNHGDQESVMYSYLVERCILDVLNGVDTCCPVHESVSPVHLLGLDGCSQTFYIAPDVVFSDLSNDLVVTHTDRLDMGEHLGRGTFGDVFAGYLFRKGQEPAVPVAIKILYNKEKHSSKEGMEQRMEVACQSYLTARQEISILEKIQHTNIVPLLGLALQPLSLLLSLAPQGGLHRILKTIGQNGQTLPLFVIRQVILQIADALMYLHNHNIIYRDLKSENILVWTIPTSSEARPSSTVLVKLADYGISQSVDILTGSKGFGGTPPFIAPEILQHAGKDTYTEKVDIFSFGMFIYELITCRLPFLDVHNPSTLVCQGKRPAITREEASVYPCYILDLMAICWSQEPDLRPTAATIIDIARSPQFCHLRDVVVLGKDLKIFCASSIPTQEALNMNDSGSESPGMGFESLSVNDQLDTKSHTQVWMSTGFGPLYYLNVYMFDRWKSCVSNQSWQLDGPEIRAMSVFDGFVWCIDDGGCLLVYCSKTRELIVKQRLPVHCHIQVHGMFHMAEKNLVLIVLKNGVILLCRHDLCGEVPNRVTITEVRVVPNICSALVKTKEGYQMWIGGTGGIITVWDFERQCLDNTKLVHSESSDLTKRCDCKFLLAANLPGSEDMLLWSYVYPGKIVYRWDVNARCVMERLDCSDIVTTTNSPVVVSSKRGDVGYQVTCLNVLGIYLYIGTTWGNVIIADAVTMKPLNVFKSHCAKEFYVKYILPLHSEQPLECFDVDENITTSPGIVTIGRGFVDMIGGAQTTDRESDSVSDISDLESKPKALSATREQALNNNFLISWSASDWQYY